MATYYWVGGTGTWDNSSTTNWASTSGGAGGAGVPTIADDVVFDNNSGGLSTITVVANSAACNNFTVTTTNAITFNGDLTKWAGSIVTPTSGSAYLESLAVSTDPSATSGTRTISVTKPLLNFSIGTDTAAAGAAVYDLTGPLNVRFTISIYRITLNTNNYDVNCASIYFYGLVVGSIINAGTSTFTMTNGSGFYNVYNSTFIDVINGSSATFNFVNGPNARFVCNSSCSFGTINITIDPDCQEFNFSNISTSGSPSIGDLTITYSPTFSAWVRVNLVNNFTITNAFTCYGSAASKRILLLSAGLTPTTFSAGSTPSLANVDFFAINATGTATWSGTSIGNAGNNSGVTFTAPKTVYRVTSNTYWVDNLTPTWSNTSGGTANDAYTPLPQDTAVFDDVIPSGIVIDLSWGGRYPLVGNINATARTTPMTLGTITTRFLYLAGDITTSSSVTLYNYLTAYVYSKGNITGPTTIPVQIYTRPNGTYSVTSNTRINGLLLNGGTVSLAANLTTAYVYNQYNGSTIAFGTNKIILTGTDATGSGENTNLFDGSNYSYICTGTPVIDVVYEVTTNYGQIFGGALTSEDNAITFNISATGGQYIERVTGNVRSLTFASGYTGNLHITPTRIYGSLSLSSSMTVTSGAAFQFYGSSTGNTVNTAGLTLSGQFNFYGVGEYSLASNITLNNYSFSVVSGTVNTNNYNITTGSGGSVQVSASASATLNLGSSTITAQALISSGLGAIVNTGTSNVIVTAGVQFSNLTAMYNLTINCSNQPALVNATSFNNLSVIATAPVVPIPVPVASLTVANTLTITGTASYPFVVYPSTSVALSSNPTITANAVSLSYVDFSRITTAGTATWTGTSVGDAGGNTGITFTQTPRTLYWVGGTGTMNSTNATNWALTSGGAGGQPAPRLCDTCIVDSNSGAGTISGATSHRIPSLTFVSGYTGTFTPGNIQFWGNLTYTSGMTLTASQGHTFLGYNCTLTSAGKTLGVTTCNTVLSSLTLGDNLTSNNQIRVSSGTWNFNDKTVTCTTLSITGTANKVYNLSSSTINCTGATGINMSPAITNLTINPGTSNIRLTANTSTAIIGGRTFNKITFAGSAGGGTYTINGSDNTIGELASTVPTAYTVKFLGASSNTINKWSISGTAGQLTTVTSTTTSQFTLVSSNGVQSADYLNLSYSIGSPSDTWYAGTHSTDSGNNTGWSFTDAPVNTGNGLFFGSNF